MQGLANIIVDQSLTSTRNSLFIASFDFLNYTVTPKHPPKPLIHIFRFRIFFLFVPLDFVFVSPEFSYRPGLSVLSEDSSTTAAPTSSPPVIPSSNNSNSTPPHGAGGPPNRPLPPTPDDDDQIQGDRTLIMKRVSYKFSILFDTVNPILYMYMNIYV